MRTPVQSQDLQRLRSLEALLDDPSPSVRGAIQAEICRLGKPALDWLEELAADERATAAASAAALLDSMAIPSVVATMRRFIRSGDYDYEAGALFIQRVVRPRIEAQTMADALDGVARRARELLAVPTTPSMIVRALNRVVYHEFGYRGEPDENPDPGTVLIGDVLALRRGIPMSLGILYLLLARRLGLNFEPVMLPERFLLGYMRDRDPFFVDPFARGRLYSWAEAQDLVPVNGLLSIQRLWPQPAGEILKRLCERLAALYQAREESERAEVFNDFVREFEDAAKRAHR